MASTHESSTFGTGTCSRRRAPHVRVGTPPRRILQGMQRAEELALPAEWHEHRYRRRN